MEAEGDTGLVTSFLEKPSPTETDSRMESVPVYLYHPRHLRLIGTFLQNTGNGPLKARDAPGHFIKYLVDSGENVFRYQTKRRFDVGSLETYEQCLKEFS